MKRREWLVGGATSTVDGKEPSENELKAVLLLAKIVDPPTFKLIELLSSLRREGRV